MRLGSGFPVRIPVAGRLRCGPGILVSWIVLTVAAQASGQGGPGLEVDPDTGAVSLCLPLGPGIGRSDLRYVPVLVGRFAPRVGATPADPLVAPDPSDQAGFELSPGGLDLWRVPGTDAADALAARWTYPDGSGGCTREEPRSGASAASLWAAFGYGAAQGAHASGAPGPDGPPVEAPVLAGRGGDVLVALPEAETGPTPAPGGEGFPAGMLAVRGAVAYEYHRARVGGPRSDPGAARSANYRLAAMRATGGDAVTFSYGANGVDFQADWDGWTLRVALAEGRANGPGSGHDAVPETAHLRVSYAGPVSVPEYTLQVAARPGEPIRRHALRVSRIEGCPAGGSTRFGYGPFSAAGPVGAGRDPEPSVLRSIELPNRSLRLDWEGGPASEAGGDGAWAFGLAELRDQAWPDHGRGADEQVYRRGPGGVGGVSTAAGERRWVRQSRHFVFGSASGQGGCQTFVRDRWDLGDPPHEGWWPAEAMGVAFPTFAYDAQAARLMPVPGQLTRRLDWEPDAIERDQAPDPHGGRPADSSGRAGLLGGTPFPDTLAAMQAAAAQQAALAREIEARRAAQVQAAMEHGRMVQQQMQHSREVARQILEARMRQNAEEEAERQAREAAEAAARAEAVERADAEARRVREASEQGMAAANQKAADAQSRADEAAHGAALAKQRQEAARCRILAAEQRAAAAREKASRAAP